MNTGTRLFNARTVKWLDVGVVVWLVVWLCLGMLIWHDIRAQATLSSNVIKIGTAVKETGDAFGVVADVPIVGGSIGGFGERISKLGAEVQGSGQDSYDGIQRVAVISGIGVGILPAALVLLLYLPVRLAWRRDVTALRAALAASGGSPAFERYLAWRALGALPWDRLAALSDDPWRDVAGAAAGAAGRADAAQAGADAGAVRALADAELQRLGLSRA